MFLVFHLVSTPLLADYFNVYVGQTFYLPVPKAPSQAVIYSWSYSSTNSKVNIFNRGMNGVSEAIHATEYFSGSQTLVCMTPIWYYGSGTARKSDITSALCLVSRTVTVSSPSNPLQVLLAKVSRNHKLNNQSRDYVKVRRGNAIAVAQQTVFVNGFEYTLDFLCRLSTKSLANSIRSGLTRKSVLSYFDLAASF